MNVVGVIPARYKSTRFPGKPLAPMLGMPMVGHCFHRTRLAPGLDAACVATCDKAIAEYVQSIGGKAVMTSSTHNRATTRTAEALEIIERETGGKIDVVVMVQGDEPMDTPEMISEALLPMLQDDSVQVVNLMGRVKNLAEHEDPNTVKVVVGPDDNAIYFSREPIPSRKKYVGDVPMHKQICIIPFRRDYLLQFNSTPEMPLECIESVDMLRVIESGGQVRMVMTEHQSIGVDTPDHLKHVEQLMVDDALMKEYL